LILQKKKKSLAVLRISPLLCDEVQEFVLFLQLLKKDSVLRLTEDISQQIAIFDIG
jgi:hypothetical protein